MKTFGVIVICTRRDYFFAKGCCASIRYFMGDVPICLLVDGDFDYSELVKTYNTQVITRRTIKNEELKRRSFGWGTTRLIAFWESPFDQFLLIDCDTVVWGDMRVYAEKLNAYDIILDQPCYTYQEEDISHWFFKTDIVHKLYPDFNYLPHPYVCPGILMANKNIFTHEEYMDVLDLVERNPGLFFPGDMGFINFMIYRKKEKGTLKVANEDIQYLVCDFKPADMASTFPIENGKPVLTKAPTVLHFTGGIKPIKYRKTDYYTEPAILFRKQYRKDAGNAALLTNAVLRFEDLQWIYRTQKGYYRKRITGLLTGKKVV